MKVTPALCALLLVVATGRSASAMDILFFARLNLDDQSTYVASMVEGAAQKLRAHGHPDQADKAIAFFKDKSRDGGVNQLALNLKALHAENDHNAINPRFNAHVYDVEDAMELTLRRQHVMVAARDLAEINRNFSPAFPLRSGSAGP